MTNWTWRAFYSVCGMAALLATPAESQGCAFLNRLFGCCGPTTQPRIRRITHRPRRPARVAPTHRPSATTRRRRRARATGCAPCAATPACTTCTASYTPQTYYRPVVRSVATTTYRPVVSYDPGTGYVQYRLSAGDSFPAPNHLCRLSELSSGLRTGEQLHDDLVCCPVGRVQHLHDECATVLARRPHRHRPPRSATSQPAATGTPATSAIQPT